MSHPGFHNKIDGDKYKAESGRYVLYASLSCPYVHRTLIIHALKGLEDAIPIVYVHPVMRPLEDGSRTWTFGGDADINLPPGVQKLLAATKELDATTFSDKAKQFIADVDYRNTTCAGIDITDKITNFKNATEIYHTDPTYDRKVFTVPVLYDTVTKSIVTNESAEILAILNNDFNAFAKNAEFTMHPSDIAVADIEKAYTEAQDKFLFASFKALFAKNQIDYFSVTESISDYLDSLNKKLATQRFVAGNSFTEADIRLVVGLLRFDPVVQLLTRCSSQRIQDYVNISAYLRDIYQNVFNDAARTSWSVRHSWLGPFYVYGNANQDGIIPITPVTDYSKPIVDRSQVGKQ